jgi:hypothetical protein
MGNTPSYVFPYLSTLFCPWQPDLQTLEIKVSGAAFMVDKAPYQMVK